MDRDADDGELLVTRELVPVVNCFWQKLERHPQAASRREWDDEEEKTGMKQDAKWQS